MKKCSKCKIIKNSTQFYKTSRTPDGYNYYCKACKKTPIFKEEISFKKYRKKKLKDPDFTKSTWRQIEAGKRKGIKIPEEYRGGNKYFYMTPVDKKK